MHGPHDSATTPRAAGHRIKSLEASGDSAAARAQTVWARRDPPSPTSRTRRRRPGCISPRPIAHAASDKEGSERSRSMARGPRARHHAWRWPRVHCIALFRASVYLETSPPPRDRMILPTLRGRRPHGLARRPKPESPGDFQPSNRTTAGRTAPLRLGWLDIASSPSSPRYRGQPRWAHAVWAVGHTPSPTSRTRWRWRRLH